MKKAVVIFSGGQDSTTCLLWAINQLTHPDNIHAVTFYYGQRHGKEIEQAQKICKRLGVQQHIIDVSFLKMLSSSALVTAGNINEVRADGLPASFVPNRNQLFITIAHALAQQLGAPYLITGVCETDYSGYPDCRQEFITAIEKATNIGSNSSINIMTPLMDLSKAETFAIAERVGGLDVVLEMSHTCYNDNHHTRHSWGYGCGECPACLLRKKGWEEYQAMIKKPVS